MKGSKKTRKNIIIAFTVILFLVVGFFATLYYITSTVNNYSYSEKKWINDNTSNISDVSVYNDVPVFGNKGNGVIFDLLDNFTDKYGINFNKVSYLKLFKNELKYML